MKEPKQIQKIGLDDILEILIELNWETIRARGFIIFHLENCFSYFLLGLRCRNQAFFSPLGDIICSRLMEGEGSFLRFVEQTFVIISIIYNLSCSWPSVGLHHELEIKKVSSYVHHWQYYGSIFYSNALKG
jgi:hypothetical protein